MTQRVDSDRSRDFHRTVLFSAVLAGLLAILIVGFYYVCAHSSRPEHSSSPPPPSGMITLSGTFATTISSSRIGTPHCGSFEKGIGGLLSFLSSDVNLALLPGAKEDSLDD